MIHNQAGNQSNNIDSKSDTRHNHNHNHNHNNNTQDHHSESRKGKAARGSTDFSGFNLHSFSSMDQSLREWEVFKYGDDYGLKELSTNDQGAGEDGKETMEMNELNTEVMPNGLPDNTIACQDFNECDLLINGNDDEPNTNFISVLNNAESIGEKFIKDIRLLKRLCSPDETIVNKYERIIIGYKKEKFKLEADLIQAKRCIECLRNQLIIVQEEADQCRKKLDDEKVRSALKLSQITKRYNENKSLLEKLQKQLTPSQVNCKRNSCSSVHGQNKTDSTHRTENGEPTKSSGSPEPCKEPQDDPPKLKRVRAPKTGSSVDLHPISRKDIESEAKPISNSSASGMLDSFEVSLKEMGLTNLPTEASDPCICAAIVLTKGRVTLHNLKRSEYLATIFEYRRYRPEYPCKQRTCDTTLNSFLPHDESQEEYDFVNMVPGPWFNSDLDGWFIGTETPEEKNRPHPHRSDYILLEGILPVKEELYVQNIVLKGNHSHATQIVSLLVRKVIPEVYVQNALLSGNTLKDEAVPAKCFVETLANGMPLGVGYRRFLAIQAHAFRLTGRYGPITYYEIQSVRSTISKCLKERRRDDRRSGHKRKRS